MYTQSQLQGGIAPGSSESVGRVRRRCPSAANAPGGSAGLDQGARKPSSNRLANFAETLRTVGAVARRMYANWQRQRFARATNTALRELDPRMLRDLGFDRSEISSVAAEAAGQIDSTRARFAQALPRLHR